MWIASGFQAIWTGQVQVFVIASGPFGVLIGYLFAGQIIRRADDVGR